MKYYPRRENLFHQIKEELAQPHLMLEFSAQKRWTVRGESMLSVINNYEVMFELYGIWLALA